MATSLQGRTVTLEVWFSNQCLSPSMHNRVFRNVLFFFPPRYHQLYLLKRVCETMLVATCWCNHNCVEVLRTPGKREKEKKNAVKSWIPAISAVVSVMCTAGLLGHPDLLGKTLQGNDGLCHSNSKRMHACPIRKSLNFVLFCQVCVIYHGLLYLTNLSSR